MFASIAQIVSQFRQRWSLEIDDEAIRLAMREAGHKWRVRDLDPVTTVRMFFLQILWGNAACNHVPHLAGKDVTGSAYCEARGRLPLPALETLLARCTAKMAEDARGAALWLGHRLLMLDGSSFSMSDNKELQEHFGQPGEQAAGCGFPVAHWLALVHYGTGLIQKALTGPLRTHDMSQAFKVHSELQPGDVLLGDRAFCSFAHVALLVFQGFHAVLRAHQRLIIDFTSGRPHAELHGTRPRKHRQQTARTKNKKGVKKKMLGRPRSRWIKKLGPLDQLVEWFRPLDAPQWMSAESFAGLPASLVVRELRYTINRSGFRVREVTLVTTLLDPEKYPKEKVAEAYGLRWTIETAFGHLKTTM